MSGCICSQVRKLSFVAAAAAAAGFVVVSLVEPVPQKGTIVFLKLENIYIIS